MVGNFVLVMDISCTGFQWVLYCGRHKSRSSVLCEWIKDPWYRRNQKLSIWQRSTFFWVMATERYQWFTTMQLLLLQNNDSQHILCLQNGHLNEQRLQRTLITYVITSTRISKLPQQLRLTFVSVFHDGTVRRQGYCRNEKRVSLFSIHCWT